MASKTSSTPLPSRSTSQLTMYAMPESRYRTRATSGAGSTGRSSVLNSPVPRAAKTSAVSPDTGVQPDTISTRSVPSTRALGASIPVVRPPMFQFAGSSQSPPAGLSHRKFCPNADEDAADETAKASASAARMTQPPVSKTPRNGYIVHRLFIPAE